MAIIEWSTNLSVDVAEIDGEHKKLIGMINELNHAMKGGQGKAALGGIVSSLTRYASSHFATEERYFEKFGYPAGSAHKKEHAAFVSKVSEFQKGFEGGRLALSIEVMSFLSDWLKGHIMGSDKKYSSFFNEKGLR